jgi:hypothetical protein
LTLLKRLGHLSRHFSTWKCQHENEMNFCQRVQFSAPSFFREGKILKDINLNEIEMNGKKYPFYCDLNVLELIQDNFKSVNQF